jgi:predicted transglutaminase-like cysteine proteinase
MSAFVCAGRAARTVAGLFLLSTCLAVADNAAARVVGARLPLESGASSSVATIPPAIDPPARFFSINRILAEHDRQTALSTAPRFVSLNQETVTVEQSPSPRTARSEEPFGLFTFRAPEGPLWAKWRGVEAAIDEEAPMLAQCRHDAEHCPSPAALRFLGMIEEAQKKAAGREKLDAVNRMVNSAILYTSDLAQHGVADLWSAPLATFTSGRGDCEDYAIAKYVLLRESGVSVQDMRLLLVRDRSADQDHAVLAVREASGWLILDNRSTVMLDTSEVRHLLPLFAIDQDGVKLFAMPYEVRLPQESEVDSAPTMSEGAGPVLGNRPRL